MPRSAARSRPTTALVKRSLSDRQAGATSDISAHGRVSLAVMAGFMVIAAWLTLTPDVPPSVRLAGLASGLAATVVIPFSLGVRHRLDVAPVLVVPVVLSATQNLLLLPLAPYVTTGQLQVLLSINLLVTALTLVMSGWVERDHLANAPGAWPWSAKVALTVMALVAIYASAQLFFLHGSLTATVGSARNLLSIPVFLLLGVLSSRIATVRRYCGAVVALGLVVVVFGLFERFHPQFWMDADLATLWQKKGIPAPINGLPDNFYSSEQVHGVQQRRMASSFADPVNLGTFLLVAFLAAWYVRRYVIAVVVLVGCVLTISKGALVGLLLFCVVAAYFYLPRRALMFAAALCGLVAAAFLTYSYTSSTGSVQAHIGGLLAGLRELPQAPLGHGVGESGVLAGMLSGDVSLPSTAAESGLGVIAGQMGFPGVIAFAVLFVAIALDLRKISDRRSLAMAWALLLGFGVNASFNEVALSPNSSGAYFLILGLLVGSAAMPSRVGVAGRPQLARLTGRGLAPAAILLVGMLVSCTATLALSSRYEATLIADVKSGHHVVFQRTHSGGFALRSRPVLTHEQLVHRALDYASLAHAPYVADTAASVAGLPSGSEVLARADASAVSSRAALRFVSVDEEPDAAVLIVTAWAEATRAKVEAQEEATWGLDSRDYTRIEALQPRVVTVPLTASTLARHLLLGLVTGLGLAVAWSALRSRRIVPPPTSH